MLLLHQSKSYTCESSLPAPDLCTNGQLEKHHSLSLLDSIPSAHSITASSANTSLSTLSFSLSNTSSSHASSNASIQESSENSLNTAFIDNDLYSQQDVTASNASSRKIKRRKDKKSKYKVATREIAMFTVRRNIEHTSLYFLNAETHEDDDDEFVKSQMNDCDQYGQTFELLSNNAELLNVKTKLNKYNKKVKLKTLVKNGDILSLIKLSSDHIEPPRDHAVDFFKRVSFSTSKNSLRKKSSRLYIKYNLYKKLNKLLVSSYVPNMDRMSHRYSTNRIDKSRLLSNDAIKSNKKVNAIINRQYGEEKGLNINNSRASLDPPVVINNSLGGHNNPVSSELNQTYDALYLEFLISIQHREITPEDYEYLSRLDEMVKKKTVSDNILKSLKCETITKEILVQIDNEQEVCGICLDQYLIEQVRKHLPCGHKFHADCIDNWLRNQSTNCPLDKIPVDPNATAAAAAAETSSEIFRDFNLNEHDAEGNENDEEEFNIICQVSGLLDELVDQLEREHNLREVENFLWDLIAKIEE
jgi:hypothetical protein